MSDNISQSASKFIIVKKASDEWFVVEPKGRRGPYRSAVVTLQVAALEVLVARRRGMKADVAVKDDYGDVRVCHLMDKDDGTQRCGECQRRWLTTKPPPLESPCPLRAALENR